MINWLQNFQGKQNTFENSAEKNELNDLRKEMNKYKRKYISGGGAVDEEGIVHSDESSHDERDDEVDDLIEQKKRTLDCLYVNRRKKLIEQKRKLKC